MSAINQGGEVNSKKPNRVSEVMVWIFFVASTAMLSYTYYRARIVYQGTMDDIYLKYYVISLAGIIFWGLVLKLKEEVQNDIILVACSLVLVLYLVEGLLILLKIDTDQRSKIQVISDFRDEGVDAVPSINPGGIVKAGGLHKVGVKLLYPFGGVSMKTTVATNENGRYMIYRSDRYGFNNPDSEWDSPNIEWLLTGDSFALGLSVQPGEEISGQIRSMTGNSVINLGLSGNGPLIELAVLKEYAESVSPKKVIWLYFEGNDLSENIQHEQGYPLLLKYLKNGFSQELIYKQKEIDRGLVEYISRAEASLPKTRRMLLKLRWLRLSGIRDLLDLDGRYTVIRHEKEVNVIPLFEKILKEARDQTKSWGGKLYFVYLPQHSRYAINVPNHSLFRKRSEVIDVVKGLNIPIIDIHSVFANHHDTLSLFSRMNMHYSPKGYREAAKGIVMGIGGKVKLQHPFLMGESLN